MNNSKPKGVSIGCAKNDLCWREKWDNCVSCLRKSKSKKSAQSHCVNSSRVSEIVDPLSTF